MKTPLIVIGAGQLIEFHGAANYFHILTATDPLSVELKRDGATIATADNVNRGYKNKPKNGFNSFTIYSATLQTVQIAVGDGDDEYNYVTGSVQIIGQQGAFAETQSSVTNADQTIKAANAARKYLLVQNNSAQVLRLTLDGAAATATRGIRIQSGGFYEPVGYIPSGAIRAFMEVADATANNVEVIEG
jgi:hypothetical protein